MQQDTVTEIHTGQTGPTEKYTTTTTTTSIKSCQTARLDTMHFDLKTFRNNLFPVSLQLSISMISSVYNCFFLYRGGLLYKYFYFF